MNTNYRRLAPTLAFTLATIVIAAASQLASAEDLPPLRQGLWSYSGTTYLPGDSKPRVRNVKLCTNPTEEIQKKLKSMAAQSCKTSPIARKGNEYVYSSSCDKNGVTISTKSTLQVDSDSAYHVTSEIRAAGGLQKELVIGQRLSSCQPGAQGAIQPPSATTRVPGPSAKRTM